MHEIQRKLLTLAQFNDISAMSYRQLAERVGGDPHAAQVRHHLMRLIADGKLVRTADGKLVVPEQNSANAKPDKLLTIPVLGEADCGEATKFASDEIRGYLAVSPSTTHYKDLQDVFALKACGDSMNRASVHGKRIEHGDYILAKKYDGHDIRDGEYVVSLINGMANVKKFHRDTSNHRIVLLSESYGHYPPIIIAESDSEYYQPIARVVDVVKGVEHLN